MLPLLLWTLPLLCQGVAAQWSRSPLTCTDASECPSYITVCRNLDYETRAYAPTVWVGTQVLPTEGRYQSVQRLREYFNKRNRPVIQIERTAPTLTMYQNVNDAPRPIAVFAYLPRRFLFNPPIPRDELVYLTLSPARTVFSRLASPFLFNMERTSQELFEDLLRQTEAFAQDHFYVAEYSSPLRLFGRRNEVWYLALGLGRCDPGPGRPSSRL